MTRLYFRWVYSRVLCGAIFVKLTQLESPGNSDLNCRIRLCSIGLWACLWDIVLSDAICIRNQPTVAVPHGKGNPRLHKNADEKSRGCQPVSSILPNSCLDNEFLSWLPSMIKGTKMCRTGNLFLPKLVLVMEFCPRNEKQARKKKFFFTSSLMESLDVSKVLVQIKS